ncbi:MAG: transcription elongation factor GreA [Planctomycetia bacterium]|nr:transcription elongation factor GreA [Planctomycetia bacterium]
MSSDKIPMTKDGYEKKKAELAHMEGVEMIEAAKRVAAARDLGDLSENAEYHAAREDHAMLQAKIDQLKDQLSRAVIVDQTALPRDAVVFGARVRIKNLDNGKDEVYQLVGPGDEDYTKNKILTTSPRGQGLLGKKVGEKVEIKVPKGTLKYQVQEISFPD